jgi:hypothetical protein
MHHQAESLRSIEMMEGGAEFSPADVSDPRIWRLPSGETVDLDGSDRIELYRNRLADAHHAGQADDTRRPALVDDDGVLAVEYRAGIDWLTLPGAASLRLTPGMNLWYPIKSSTTSTSMIVTKWEGGVTPRRWWLIQAWGNGGPCRWGVYDSENNLNQVDGPVITDGQRHVVRAFYSRDAETIGIQVDGGTVFTTTLADPPADHGQETFTPIATCRRFDVDSNIPQALHYEEFWHVVPEDEQAAGAEIAALWSYFGRLL